MTEIWSYRASVVTEPAVEGYAIRAVDGSIGTVDHAGHDSGYSYVVVDTGSRGQGRKVLLPAGVVESIDHGHEVVYVSKSIADVEAAPAFDERAERGEAYLQPFGDYYWGSYGNVAE